MRALLRGTGGKYLGVAAAALISVAPIKGNDGLAGNEPLPLLEQAVELIDASATTPIEGIWQYPGEDAKVLIWRDDSSPAERYRIMVLEAFDYRLEPGDVIGWLKPLADKKKFELEQYTRKNSGLFDMPGKCLLTMGADGNTLVISGSSGGKLKISINPTSLLPRFWRIVKLNVKMPENPGAEGLRRLYPAQQGSREWTGHVTL